MGRRARSHYSAPPTASLTPGIVEHGETMVITRRAFITPDAEPRPIGRRTLAVGRKVYAWSAVPLDATAPTGGFVSDRLSDKDDGTAPVAAALANGHDGFVSKSPTTGHVIAERTTDMGDDPLPAVRRCTPPAPVKTVKVPKPAKAPAPKSAKAAKAPKPAKAQAPKANPPVTRQRVPDDVIRRFITRKGLPSPRVITPRIRAIALDEIAREAQLSDYAGGKRR